VPFAGDNFVAVAMRHVNEPAPSVLEHRPDCPLGLDLAVQRAMAKDPADRFESMDDFVIELEACLAEVDGRGDEGATMIVPPARPHRRRVPRARRAPGATTLLLVGLIAAAIAVGGFLLLRDGGAPNVLPGKHSSKPVRLLGFSAFDPFGDGREHDEDAPAATNRDPTSGWTTEHYDGFTKPGVGLVLRTPRRMALSRLTVASGGGFEAKVQAGNSPAGPFADVADWQEIGERTTFKIDTNGKDYGYYMVWLRLPRSGGQAEIDEVTART
jgi:hypothetical protein